MVLDVDHLRMMEKPVEDRRGDDRVAEELLPIAEAFVRGQDRRAFLVPVGDELEKEIRLAAVDRQVAGLVDDDETGAVIGLALALGFLELADQRLHGCEVDPDAVAAGLDRQGGGQMGLADTWRAQEDDVFAVGDEPASRELFDPLPVDRGLEGEVEVLQRLHERELGHGRAHGDVFLLLRGHFPSQKLVQEVGVGKIGLGRFLQAALELVVDSGESKMTKIFLDFVEAHFEFYSKK